VGVARHVWNVAASAWLDDTDLAWLEHLPKINLLMMTDAREPYPLSRDEQARLIQRITKLYPEAEMGSLVEAASQVVGEGLRNSLVLVVVT